MSLAGVRRTDCGEPELDHMNQWGGGCIFLCGRGRGLGLGQEEGEGWWIGHILYVGRSIRQNLLRDLVCVVRERAMKNQFCLEQWHE